MVGSSPTPAKLSMNAMATSNADGSHRIRDIFTLTASSSKKAGRPVLNWKTAGQYRQRPPLFGLVMKWKTSAVEIVAELKQVLCVKG